MQKSESIAAISKAIVAVMKEVKGIEKNLNVGTGNATYKGVADQDVKKEVGAAMEKHGLCLVPIGVEPKMQIERWEESTNYGNKTKQQVFTEVTTKYLLLHESGEWMELSGYGHGVDTQDKSAGKATTYALKYTLLYTFMVPTGKIDDADNTASQDYQSPQGKQQQPTIKEAEKRNEEIKAAVKKLAECNTVEALKALKAALPDYVKTNASFVEHATTRYKELTAVAA